MSDLSEVARSTKSAAIICPPKEYWQQIQDIRSQHDKAYDRWMPHINLLFPFIEDEKSTFATAATALTRSLAQVAPFRVAFTADSFVYFDHGKKCVMWLKPLVVSAGAMSAPSRVVTQLKPLEKRDTPPVQANLPPSIDNLRHAIWMPGDKDSDADRILQESVPNPTSGSTTGSTSGPVAEQLSISTPPNTPQDGAATGHHKSVLEIEGILRQTFPQLVDETQKRPDGYHPHLTLGQFGKKEIKAVMDNYRMNWTDIVFDVKDIYLISRKDFHDPFHIREIIPLGLFSGN